MRKTLTLLLGIAVATMTVPAATAAENPTDGSELDLAVAEDNCVHHNPIAVHPGECNSILGVIVDFVGRLLGETGIFLCELAMEIFGPENVECEAQSTEIAA